MTRSTHAVSVLVLSGAALAPRLALAADAPAQERPAERRSGVVVGMSIGAGLFGASGYPDSALKTGDPAYYSSSGLMGGTSTELFVMGALADVLNFGLWVAGSGADNGTFHSRGTAGGFRVEAFPLYSVAPRLRDLGLHAKFGLGGMTLDAKDKVSPGAGGTQSFLGAGAFYELRLFSVLGGHTAIAPTIEYQSIFSTSAERHGGFAGARFAFYGGP